ncbi:hypothetical protein PHYBLDRAFT_170577 [Phycomyces blakesleeanus NRRL 1555(-)]|uniref:Uncharacterized protein n=1 Tax=Phycomyces blakesleeanus (strain ATCC 8743b / DSM 1359 / FGSC 10004 / NBRC 33097 / NRRL 1555) TaxID=763407 RepID=A0A163DH51_PHYB8|nr:hypothetical protein PHYBLDRAFT_170577 [Phycomyces blakesleeanus NRRL 1555(-)]OAD71200.1 hypothetical protein PHYBLDRAFT_170577 [Phycomyces blakesleeanus NRRL 1555(-)]|eukprot:XP_018289240.1 hypothetical protein PHYBLDRAFT_170577 [Phycomyces blakesleeanus NRRL 1555(-)]
MYGLCHGISKQVWGLVSGTYGTDHCFALSSGVRKEIGTAMYKTRNTIPTSFHGDWRDVYKNPGSFKAVDWADFLLFVVPTLVAERIGDTTACSAKLVSWNTYLENLYVKDLVELPVFTINQHLLKHYPEMVDAYGPPRAYSARSLERAIGEYSCSIKSNSAIGVNAGNIMVRLARTRRVDLKDSGEEANRATALEYDDVSAGWPMTEEGERDGAESDIEYWGPLRRRLIDESFKGISCLPILIQAFCESKGVGCSRIEPVMTTSRKAFINGCVIDSSFAQTPLRKAHHVRLQVQVDLFRNVRRRYTPIIKDFFGKVVLFFEHENSGKRWPLALVQVYSVEEYNGVPVAKN